MQGDGSDQNPETVELDDLKAGLPSAWKEILALHGPKLLNYAIHMLGDRAAAEEVVQDSLVNIYRTIESFDGRCSIKSWLYRAVHNSAIDEIRRRKRYVDVGHEAVENHFKENGRWKEDCQGWDGLAARQLDEKRLLAIVRHKIGLLPHACREVILMKDVEGLCSTEISDVLGISPGNLRIRIHRARAALRAMVMKEDKL